MTDTRSQQVRSGSLLVGESSQAIAGIRAADTPGFIVALALEVKRWDGKNR
ncbi:MAG: hypothetical protein WDO74_28885 [Pseudomonadota bacterium]